jgi:hypothetical protein
VPAAADPQEPMEVVARRLDEIDELIKNGQIWDGQALATWAIVRQFLIR